MNAPKKHSRLEIIGGIAFLVFVLVFGTPVAWVVVKGGIGMWSDILDDGDMNWSNVR